MFVQKRGAIVALMGKRGSTSQKVRSIRNANLLAAKEKNKNKKQYKGNLAFLGFSE